MNIELRRIRHRPETIDGHIYIDGAKVCDSAENNHFALATGTYPITLVKCHQHARKMPVIKVPNITKFQSSNEPGTLEPLEPWNPQCETCPKLSFVGNNSTMPMICPMLKPGNGVYKRTDGSIIVGRYLAPGCLSHPLDAFHSLYERIRKNIERGNPVQLIISSI